MTLRGSPPVTQLGRSDKAQGPGSVAPRMPKRAATCRQRLQGLVPTQSMRMLSTAFSNEGRDNFPGISHCPSWLDASQEIDHEVTQDSAVRADVQMTSDGGYGDERDRDRS